MADITTVWNPQAGAGDWVIPDVTVGIILDETGASILDDNNAPLNDGLYNGGGDLVSGDDLVTAVLISLFTDAAAGPDDVIPDGTTDPRGWWGDLGEDRPIGSKIWLRVRSKRTDLTAALVKNDIQQALQWLLDDGVAGAVDVLTEWDAENLLAAQVTITRPDGRTTALRFDWAWKEL